MACAVDVESGLIQVTLSGVVTGDDLRQIGDAAAEIEAKSSPITPRITDLTAVTELKIGYGEVQELAARRRVIQFPNSFKSAILVSSPSQLGMARMFQTLNDNPQITIEIFTDRASALAWVRS
jgi:hypothetical protein